MKKEYKKPVIVMEDFSLSTSIATECDVETGNPSYNECGMDMSGLIVFLSSMGGCTHIKVDDIDGDGGYGDICYHVVAVGRNVFNS